MTEEEKLAHTYAIENWEHYEEGQNDYGALKKAYLAGFKAGRPKWHDLRKNSEDLPKRDERFSTNISIAVMTQDNNFAFYCFDDRKWYSQGVEIGNVIAWCKIPEYMKEDC